MPNRVARAGVLARCVVRDDPGVETVNWLCTLVVVPNGLVQLEHYRLVKFPVTDDVGWVEVCEAHGRTFWAPGDIRTLEVRPVTNHAAENWNHTPLMSP